MSENCHNSGKIYWNLLGESLTYKFKTNGYDERYTWSINSKTLEHFSNVMANVIKEFAETYNKEDRYVLNPTKWEHGDREGGGWQISYANGLIGIYVILNLILLNSKLNETPLLTEQKWLYNLCSGDGDYTQDEYLASKFRGIRIKLFERYTDDNLKFQNRIKLLTKELVEEIRDYLKEVFECLIRIYQSEKHRDTVDRESIFNCLSKWLWVELV